VTTLLIRNSIWRNGVLSAITIAFVIASAWELTSDSSGGKFSLSALLFFAFGSLLFGWRTLDRRPRLIIDENGVTDPRSALGLIPWSQITSTRIRYMGKVDSLEITPRNPNEWLGKLPYYQRLSWRLFPKRKAFRFTLQNMDVPTTTIASFLEDMGKGGALRHDLHA
jgi:hypothetical protein